MSLSRLPVLLALLAVPLLRADPTAPVDVAHRNGPFAPADAVQTPEVKPAAAQKRDMPATATKATVAKPTAAVADRRAPLDAAPRRESVQTPDARVITPGVQVPQPGSLTNGATILHPKDSPVRSVQGSKFQDALNSARAASAVRAKEYEREAKLKKVNEFVPTANPPAGTVPAGSEDKR